MKTNAVSYALRANPKKSLRGTDSHSSTTTRLHNDDLVCRICGKGFEKIRQLCGHLRHHSISGGDRGVANAKCKECGKSFKSIRALCGHMKSHGVGAIRVSDVSVTDCSLFLIRNVGVRKRPRTPRFEVSKRSRFYLHSSDLNCEEDDAEVENSALQEVAASLIMLSKGFEFSGDNDNLNAVDLVDESSKKSDGLEFVTLGNVEMGSDACEMELNVCENRVEVKNVGFGLGVKDEHNEMGGVHDQCSDHVKPEDDICGGVLGSVLKYRCITCNKEYSTYQGLGGHRSSKHHRLPRCSKVDVCQSTIAVSKGTSKKPECAVNDAQKGDVCSGIVPHFGLLKKCKHKPALKISVSRSSQALGGHIGACVAEGSTTDQVQQPVISELMRCSSALKIVNCHISVTQGTSEKPECTIDDRQKDEHCAVSSANFDMLKMCKFECGLCLKVFRSAQALGVHMGAHLAESSVIDQVQLPGGSMQGSGLTEFGMILQSPLSSPKMIVS